MCSLHVISHEARVVLARENRALGYAGIPSALAIVSHLAAVPENPGGGSLTPLIEPAAGIG